MAKRKAESIDNEQPAVSREVALVATGDIVVLPDATLGEMQAQTAREAARNVLAVQRALVQLLPPDKFAEKVVGWLDDKSTANFAMTMYARYVGQPAQVTETKQTATRLDIKADVTGFSDKDLAAAMSAIGGHKVEGKSEAG